MLLNLVPRLTMFSTWQWYKSDTYPAELYFCEFWVWGIAQTSDIWVCAPPAAWHGCVLAPRVTRPRGGCRYSPAGLLLRLFSPKIALRDYGVTQEYNVDMQLKHLLIINQLLTVTAELATNETGVLVCLAQSNPEMHPFQTDTSKEGRRKIWNIFVVCD